jgi:hypothetical protein
MDSTFAIIAGMASIMQHLTLFHRTSLGSDTTTGTLMLLLYYLLGDQETYKKLHTELDAHYSGPEEIDDYKKLMDLPYLSGTVHEGLRLGTVIEFGGLGLSPPMVSIMATQAATS